MREHLIALIRAVNADDSIRLVIIRDDAEPKRSMVFGVGYYEGDVFYTPDDPGGGMGLSIEDAVDRFLAAQGAD